MKANWRMALQEEGMTRKADYRGALLALLLAAGILWAPVLRAEDAAGLYKAKCALCHGADGKGETPVGKKMGLRDFASPEVQKMSDSELASIISKGKNKMPSYEDKLSKAQVKELIAHIRQLAKGK